MCMFRLSDITSVLDTSLFKSPPSPNENWLPYTSDRANSEGAVPIPRPGMDVSLSVSCRPIRGGQGEECLPPQRKHYAKNQEKRKKSGEILHFFKMTCMIVIIEVCYCCFTVSRRKFWTLKITEMHILLKLKHENVSE